MILNLTQHTATAEQREDGVIELTDAGREAVRQSMTWDHPPTIADMEAAAERIAVLATLESVAANGGVHAICMLGGAPWFMPHLERALRARGHVPAYSFSRRESVEEAQPDGSVVKRSVFRHVGWVGQFWTADGARPALCAAANNTETA